MMELWTDAKTVVGKPTKKPNQSKQTDIKCWQECGETATLFHCSGDVK
jgi:hypothetical protein